MWWLSDTQDVHRLEDRVSILYVEHSHVDRDENAIVLINRQHRVHVPGALIATLLLGPGTRVTAAAMRLLADSGTAVCWVGEQGVRMYAAGLGLARSSALLLRQAYLVTHPRERLRVARQMYAMRFPGEDVSRLTLAQLRGREGLRVKRLYKEHSRRTGVPWTARRYRVGDAYAVGDDVNRLLSALNSCLYGVCHAVIAGLGASPGLGFVHSGSAISFVLDVADLYKAEYTIPLAFDLAASGLTRERDARVAFRDKVAEAGLLARVVLDVQKLLVPEGVDDWETDGGHRLWDEELGEVAGGVNWASALLSPDDVAVVGFTGPKIEEGCE